MCCPIWDDKASLQTKGYLYYFIVLMIKSTKNKFKKKRKEKVVVVTLNLTRYFFEYPLSLPLLSPMCKCDFSYSHVYFTLSVLVLFFICLTATFLYWFLLFFVVCVFSYSMSPDGWLAFCCMLVVMSQFEYSQTVSRTMGIPVNKGNVNPLTPNHDSSSFFLSLPPSFLHVPKPTRRSDHPRPHCVHSMVRLRVACGRHPLARGFEISLSLNLRTHKSFKQPSFLSVSSRSSVTCVLVDPKDTWIFLYLCKLCQVMWSLWRCTCGVFWCLWLQELFFFAAADKGTRTFTDNSW